ncbi:LysR family transcriptional regulator [Oceanobacter mangrovi]|uniref:LysR family transcriptional regulator n=1 Tax=Oceanobacter mangrovi TaxID=2862510 RepID=UPI002484B461|nr:LysR family transcriptional regulator [Oceanobacter mangrovi]
MKAKHMLAQVTDFDLKLIRLFKTVSESGGFAAAESTLGISRSAISLHMSDLEKRLGMRLCQRGRGGFSLTDEGLQVLQAADAMLAAIENFRTDVNGINEELRGELNIGIMNSLVTQSQMRITNALSRLRSKGAGVRINISMTTPSEIEKGVLDGRFHVGAVPLITPISGLDYQSLYEEHSFLYCSDQHPLYEWAAQVTATELKQFDAVVPSYRMTPAAMAQNQQLRLSATASDREGIAFLVLTGKYIGYLPDHYAKQWIDSGRMRAINPQEFSLQAELAMVTRQGRRPNLVLETFLDAL